MSVDTSVSVGVGFLIDNETFAQYRKTVDNEEHYVDDELLEKLPLGPELTFGTGGSYYDSKPLTHWIAVKRLTTSHDVDDIPGGVVGLNKPTITLEERRALESVARLLGQPDPVIGQFMSVLWH